MGRSQADQRFPRRQLLFEIQDGLPRVFARLLPDVDHDGGLAQPEKAGDKGKGHGECGRRHPCRKSPDDGGGRDAGDEINDGQARRLRQNRIRLPEGDADEDYAGRDHDDGQQSLVPADERAPATAVRCPEKAFHDDSDQAGDAGKHGHVVAQAGLRSQPDRRKRDGEANCQVERVVSERPQAFPHPPAQEQHKPDRPGEQRSAEQLGRVRHHVHQHRLERQLVEPRADVMKIELHRIGQPHPQRVGHLPHADDGQSRDDAGEVWQRKQLAPPPCQQAIDGHRTDEIEGRLRPFGQRRQAAQRVAQAPLGVGRYAFVFAPFPDEERARQEEHEQRIGFAKPSQFQHLSQAGERQRAGERAEPREKAPRVSIRDAHDQQDRDDTGDPQGGCVDGARGRADQGDQPVLQRRTEKDRLALDAGDDPVAVLPDFPGDPSTTRFFAADRKRGDSETEERGRQQQEQAELPLEPPGTRAGLGAIDLYAVCRSPRFSHLPQSARSFFARRRHCSPASCRSRSVMKPTRSQKRGKVVQFDDCAKARRRIDGSGKQS